METSYLELPDFALESGVTLPRAILAYATLGALNAARSNAVLLPSWYGADLHGYDSLIGPGRAVDPDQHFIILSAMFGNGESSSPSNTPPPYDGPRFPRIAIRDNVAATHHLVTQHLGLSRLKAVIGFSMGGQQAYQWAVSHPELVEAIVCICGAAKTYPHGFVRLESAIRALTADAAFRAGEYEAPPVEGLKAWSAHWVAWIYSQEWWRREMFRPAQDSVADVLQAMFQDFSRHDANDLIAQAVTWQHHDVGDTPGFDGDVERALHSIKARVLSMPGQTDLYFPVGDAVFEHEFVTHGTLAPIPSLWGHASGLGFDPVDAEFINSAIREFMSR
jgi:homoserine O-acetyltransferase